MLIACNCATNNCEGCMLVVVNQFLVLTGLRIHYDDVSHSEYYGILKIKIKNDRYCARIMDGQNKSCPS